MQINHIINWRFSESPTYRLSRSDNHLGIEKIDLFKDKQRKHLILIMECNQIVGKDVYALLKGNNLILEAPVSHGSYDKPIRTHLVDQNILTEVADGDVDIGFTEITMNPGFHYTISSCRVLNPGLVKIILGYRPVIKSRNHKLNQKSRRIQK